MMPSMRKKVSSFFKQLSVSGHTDCDETDSAGSASGSFIQRYLSGNDFKRHEPTILYGRTPQELPPLAVGHVITSQKSIFASMTGPDGGLTTVNQRQKHLSTSDPDVDYIDLTEVIPTSLERKIRCPAASTNCVFSGVSGRWFKVPQSLSLTYPIDNSEINIRAGGQLFSVGKKSVCTSVSDLTDNDIYCGSDVKSHVENVGMETTEEKRGKISEENFRADTCVPLGKFSEKKKTADEELLDAIDRTLIRFGLDDSCRTEFDSNMNEEIRPHVDSSTEGTEALTPDIENLKKKTSEFEQKHEDSKKRRKDSFDSSEKQFAFAESNVEMKMNKTKGDDNNNKKEEETFGLDTAGYYAVTKSTNTRKYSLRKSKSAPNPFKNARLRSAAVAAVCVFLPALPVIRAEEREKSKVLRKCEEVAGISDWNRPHNRAYGLATTLYEKNPITKQHAGSPIADCFAVVARENSAVLALADGVNWGEKSCIAARSAVHGCVEYLNKTLFNSYSNIKITNTTEVFVSLLRSFHMAHSFILQTEGMLTTLTVAVILPLASNGKYIACVCNVGDSLAYVYSVKFGVREITKGSHDIYCMRDMRDALGALGPVDGTNPELSNLTCSMTEVESGDIVFITSDGISDNFDPVVGKFAVLPSSKPDIIMQNLPIVQAVQRHELTLLRLEDLLRNNVSGDGPICTVASDLCSRLLDFVFRLTSAKRKILEDLELYYSEENGVSVELSKAEQRSRRKNACEKLMLVPGKLDHASVVAYNVGRYSPADDNCASVFGGPSLSSWCESRPAPDPENANKFKTSLGGLFEEDEINENAPKLANSGNRKSVYDNGPEKDESFETPL